jgi:hypothetical protein
MHASTVDGVLRWSAATQVASLTTPVVASGEQQQHHVRSGEQQPQHSICFVLLCIP